MRVRILTINLEGLHKRWFEARRDALVRQLEPLQPDVLCLQEVTVRNTGGAVYDQAADVADAIGLPYVAFDTYGTPQDVDTDHQHGIAIACRWPLQRVRDRRLPRAEHDPPDGRVVLLAQTMAPGGGLDVVNTHLAWRPTDQETRRLQAKVIFEDFTRNRWNAPGAHAVLAGDFNATPDEPVIARAAEGLRDVWREAHPDAPGHTWVKRNPYTEGWDMPDRRLDYIFCPPGVAIRDVQVVLDQDDPVFPSDHFGVLADLEWRDAR